MMGKLVNLTGRHRRSSARRREQPLGEGGEQGLMDSQPRPVLFIEITQAQELAHERSTFMGQLTIYLAQ